MGIEVRKVYRSSSLVGLPVRDPHGDPLGTIKEVVFDIENGRVAYLVLSVGGFWGVGEKLLAVPWNQFVLKFGERSRYFVLDVDAEQLQSAPGFDKDNWPDRADPNWLAQPEARDKKPTLDEPGRVQTVETVPPAGDDVPPSHG